MITIPSELRPFEFLNSIIIEVNITTPYTGKRLLCKPKKFFTYVRMLLVYVPSVRALLTYIMVSCYCFTVNKVKIIVAFSKKVIYLIVEITEIQVVNA